MTTPAGTDVPVLWRGRRVLAFVPLPLAQRDLALHPDTVRRTATAAAQVATAASDLPPDHLPLARLLLRSEGIASSYVEGVTAAVVDVVLAGQPGAREHTSAAWVAANLTAVTEAVADAATGRALDVGALCDWHRTLMTGAPAPAGQVGVLRAEQGWIGGTSPLDAHLVTPPAEHLEALLADLVGYVNRDDVDPVAQAAVAHAQFELIHPFGDGNGRVGRVLIAWLLTRRLRLLTPPPVSTLIAADVGGYAAGLVQFRFGEHDRWVRWFADAVAGAALAQRSLVTTVGRLRAQWAGRLAGCRIRSDSSAWRVLDLLPAHLVLTAQVVAREIGVPVKTAHVALRQLADAGVLTVHGVTQPSGRGRPARLYVSAELLGLVGSNPLR